MLQRPTGRQTDTPEPELLTLSAQQRSIGEKELARAIALLGEYKDGKANLERRVVEDERWYQLRHWEVIRKQRDPDAPEPEPSSAWLFNSVMNKHADAMDNYPEPNVLPRERSDEEDAKSLSSILPVILERGDFEETYSDNWWEKLKHGTGVYGVFWDNTLENGLGDVSIQAVDLLNVFWEPGVTDIQKSRNVFVVNLQDEDLLEAEYPQLKGKLGGQVIDVKQYVYDDTVDTSRKAAVVDWYYKVRAANGRTLLHYAKFVGSTLLFASENEPDYQERGWYDHGEYPFVFDTLFPEKGTPVGFGLIAITKDPQLYIDKLSTNLLKYADIASRVRYFAGASTGVNKKQFLDLREPIVEVEGSLDDLHIRPIEVGNMDSIVFNLMQMKIDELKETSANRDVTQGSTGSGVTAASAIAALQEAGNKSSRDMISGSYRRYAKIGYLCIELIRQFYDEARCFRITGQDAGQYQFIDYSNAGIRDQAIGLDSGGLPLVRRPVFDIKIRAQKRSPFTREVQNQRATEMYGAGFFNPERAQEAVCALEMMDFEGKDKVLEQVRQGQTLLNLCQQMSRQMDQMALLLQSLTGRDMGIGTPDGKDGGPQADRGAAMPAGALARGAAQAQKAAATPYMQKLAANATPDLSRAGRGLGAG